jgi:hypothetical protein
MTMSDNAPIPQRELRPVPDPSVLTTAQLLREIDNVGRILRAEMAVIQEQISGDRQVNQVRSRATEEQFAAIEAWRKEQKVDTKTAVDAALTAASTAVREQTTAGEKAIAKSEASASEQSKLQAATFAAELKGISVVLSDVKDRVTKIEAMKTGQVEQRDDQRGSTNNVATIVGIAVSLFVLLGILGSVAIAMSAK